MHNKNVTYAIAFTLMWQIGLFGTALSAEVQPLQHYIISGSNDSGQVVLRDFGTGVENVIDTVQFLFANGIAWEEEDLFHGRIFFLQGPQPYPFRTHYYDLNTRQISDLPYDNYGDYDRFIISPQGRYIIFTYCYVNDTTWSPDQYKAVVLDGDSLNQLSERIGLFIRNETLGLQSFVTKNNNYLINPEYLATSDTSKEDAFVIYSLPGLQPLDTLFYRHFQWQSYKKAWDISANGILFLASKTDTTRGLPPGNYAFVVGWPNRRLETRFVPLAPGNNIDAKLSPESDEIDVLYPSEGKLRRYPVARRAMLGEIDVPQGSAFDFYGTDGNLYLSSPGGYIVVDYRNNQIIRQFNFSGE